MLRCQRALLHLRAHVRSLRVSVAFAAPQGPSESLALHCSLMGSYAMVMCYRASGCLFRLFWCFFFSIGKAVFVCVLAVHVPLSCEAPSLTIRVLSTAYLTGYPSDLG